MSMKLFNNILSKKYLFLFVLFSWAPVHPLEGNSTTELQLKHRVRRLAYPKGSVLKLTVELKLPSEVTDGVKTNLALQFNIDINLPTTARLNSLYYTNYRNSKASGVLSFYRSLQTSMYRMGLNGKMCLKRAICEIAENPFHEDGFLGELISFILSASKFADNNATLYEYIQAEELGRSNGNCWKTYPKCPFSIFNIGG